MFNKDKAFNERYRPASRQGSSVFSELEKTSVTQANNSTEVKPSTSPHLTKAVVLIVVLTGLIVVSCVTTIAVVLNLKEEGGETTTGAYELFLIVVIK